MNWAHDPDWHRGDVAELTDHPRGLRIPSDGAAHGVTVWVTRCLACSAPLLCVGAWGAGAGSPPLVPPTLILDLVDAELSPEHMALLDRDPGAGIPPLPRAWGTAGDGWRGV
ncbi:hypothetical protein DMH08_35735 [Actinomadura sp. WAC 06369]|nr:hypothetical protein DMH08_35735 [Actinomadura sp. WAC 06369]